MHVHNSTALEAFFFDAIDSGLPNERGVDEVSPLKSVLHRIIGGPGEDHLLGTLRDDLMVGKDGNDHFASLGGDDRLVGGHGADVLDGGNGDDRLIGGNGGDYLMGRSGSDTLTGGSGRNQFAFQDPASANADDRDVITDFDRGLDRLNFVQLPLGGSEGGYRFIGGKEFDGAGEVRMEHGKHGSLNLLVNMDDDGKAEFVIHLQGVSRLTADDFYF